MVLKKKNKLLMPPTYGSLGSQTDLLTTEVESCNIITETEIKKGYYVPKRFIFSFLCFTACCLAVSYNVNLSIAIVSMTKEEIVNASSFLSPNFTEYIQINNVTKTDPLIVPWNGKIKGIALGAVYYGQLISFIPGGRMAELYGGKKLLICCTLIASFATLLSPITAMWSPYAFVIARIFVGIGTGPIIPIVFYMLAHWIPEQERSFHASFIISGYGIGSFLAMILSGLLCSSIFLGGWPSVFYIGALCGVLWSFVCLFLMTESPASYPNISKEELSYIEQGLSQHKEEKIQRIPWKKMACSIPLWALAIGYFGQFWLLGFFSTVHALYMGTVLKLPIAKNGVLSCLPHLLRAFATCFASYPVDKMLERNIVSVGLVRKSATIVNTVVSCGALLGITYVGRDVTATTFLFILAGILGEFVTFGVCMGCIDIAPNLSGTVSGILNIVGVFPFFIIPTLVGWLTNYENSIENWKRVFYFTICIVSLCTIIFTLFGDLKPQSWGVVQKKRPDVEEITEIPQPDDLQNS